MSHSLRQMERRLRKTCWFCDNSYSLRKIFKSLRREIGAGFFGGVHIPIPKSLSLVIVSFSQDASSDEKQYRA